MNKIIHILLIFFMNVCYAQLPPTQNEIIGFENTHLYKDFGFRKKKNPNHNPKKVVTATLFSNYLKGKDVYSFASIDTRIFNDYLLQNNENEFFSYSGESSYKYIFKYLYLNGKISASITFDENENKTGSGVKYEDRSTGSDKKLAKIVYSPNQDDYETLYKRLPNNILESESDTEKKTFWFDNKGRVEKALKYNKIEQLESIAIYAYNFEDASKDFTMEITEGSKHTVYNLDFKGNVTQKIITDLVTGKVSGINYYYKFDKHQNWVICYASGFGSELSDKIKSTEIREIHYADGNVTGYSDLESPFFKLYIAELKQLDFFSYYKETLKAEYPQTPIWIKNKENTSFWFFNKGENISQHCKSLFGGENLIIFDTISKKLYEFKNFKTEQSNLVHQAALIMGNVEFGFIVGFEDYLFDLYDSQGNNINTEVASAYWSNDQLHFMIILKNGNKFVIPNFRDYKPFHPINIVPFSEGVYGAAFKQEKDEKKQTNFEIDPDLEAFKTCEERSCFITLYEAKVDEYLSHANDEQAKRKLANYLIKLDQYDSGMPFKVLMKTKAEGIDAFISVKQYIPKEVLNRITSSANQLIDDYNKHMNSKETKDNIKEYGGTIKN